MALQALNEDGCMLGAKIVWMTLMETRSVRRWAACKWHVPCWGVVFLLKAERPARPRAAFARCMFHACKQLNAMSLSLGPCSTS